MTSETRQGCFKGIDVQQQKSSTFYGEHLDGRLTKHEKQNHGVYKSIRISKD